MSSRILLFFDIYQKKSNNCRYTLGLVQFKTSIIHLLALYEHQLYHYCGTIVITSPLHLPPSKGNLKEGLDRVLLCHF